MKVVHLGSSDSAGGAALASVRLHNALLGNGIDSKMLVRHKCKADNTIFTINQLNYFAKKEIHPRFIAEKLLFMPFEKSKKERFAFSTGKFGFPVHQNILVREADVLHMHWINSAFISLREIKRLTGLGKPIVWTLHDMWSFTGGCHYAGSCLNYQSGCGFCPMLKIPSENDLSAKIFNKKLNIYKDQNITIVACSKWLAEIAKDSSLFSQFNVVNIPNPIDQFGFFPMNKQKAKEELGFKTNKIYLLFAAGNIFDERKGIRYLVEALKILSSNTELINRIELLVMGKSSTDLTNFFPVPVNYLGMVSGKENLRRVYSAVDAFMLPSLQDNLPNTIMESLACGTPVIAFKTGGVPEMIDHKKTGFLAVEKSSDSFAEGIIWLTENSKTDFVSACVEFVKNNYSEKVVAEKYLQLYRSLKKNGQ